MLPSKIDWLKI